MTEVNLASEASASLVIAWRSGRKAHGRLVRAGGEVIKELKEYAARSLDKMNDGQSRPYDPNDEQDEEAAFLEANIEELLDTALLEEIRKGPSLPVATDQDLHRTLALYALVVGDDPENLVAFTRKGNPVKLATKGMLAALLDNSLTKLQSPLFAFDQFFDCVIYSDTVRIIYQKNFEALFKESEAVLSKTAEWADSLAESLPMSDKSRARVAERIRQNSVMRRRVQSILKSEYLSGLTLDLLREKMLARGMDPERLMDGDGLVVDSETEGEILLLLNEDLWTGDFSGEQYAATRKSRR